MTEHKTANEIMRLSEDFKNSAGAKPASFCFAENLIDFLIILPLLLFILHMAKAPAFFYFTSILIPLNILLLTLNRLKSKKLGFFMLFLLIITAGAFSLSVILKNYMAAVFSVISAPVSYSKLKNALLLYGKNNDVSNNKSIHAYRTWITVYGCALLFYLVYMLSFYYGYKDLMLFCFADFAVIFAVMLIYLQKSGSYCFSRWNSFTKAGGTDVKSGGIMFALFAVVDTVLIFSVDLIIAGLSGISGIDSKIIAFIAWIFNFRISYNVKPSAISSQYSNIKLHSGSSKVSSNYMSPKHIIFYLPEYFAYILIAAAAVFFVILICILSKSAWQKLRKNTETRFLVTRDSTVKSIKSKIDRISQSFNTFSHLNNRMKIRKLFLMHVKKHGGNIVKNSDTPYEIGGKIVKDNGHDLKDAANCYEKARYSINECDDDDLKHMKDALKL